MDFGVSYFPTDDAVEPGRRSARTVEERGFESLFVTEHTHIPAEPRDALPGRRRAAARVLAHLRPLRRAGDGRGRDRDSSRSAPRSASSSSATRSTTAKEVASLDRLSGGRLLFGVGAGWNCSRRCETTAPTPKRRFGILRERIEAMKEIWTSDEAEYHGKHVDFDPICCWPKPVQKPHPPILVGGNGADRVRPRARLRRRVVPEPDRRRRLHDGLDRASSRSAPRRRAAARFRSASRSRRREPERLERFEKAGVTRAVFMLRAGEPAEMERKLDQFTEAKDAYHGGR